MNGISNFRHIAPRPTYEHVVVPLDGSPVSRRALAAGRYLADETGASLYLFHAQAHWERKDSGQRRDLEDLARSFGAIAEVRTEAVADTHPARLIEQFASELGDTAIVMASHGRSAIGERIAGSTTLELIRDFGRPVVVIGPSAAARSERVTRVVACLDGTHFSEEILDEAAGWARDLRVPLWLYEVVEPDIDRRGVFESNSLIYAARFLAGEGLDVEWDVLHGDHPGRTLVGAAQDQPGTMLVVATRCRSGAAAVFAPGVAHELIRHSPGPVIVKHPLPVRAGIAANASPERRGEADRGANGGVSRG